MTSRTQLAAAVLLACAVPLLAACATTGAGGLKYRFEEPDVGAAAGRDRIRAIDRILAGKPCQTPNNAAACSLYAMEASLIYARVESQGVESDNLLRRAFDLQPTCDLRLLRAASIARLAQRRRDLSPATALLAGEGERCDGTVARYYAAKLNILSNDARRVAAGRAQLADLSGYSLGNSGIADKDLYDLGVYSFVSTAEFESAERQLREALDENVDVSPKLQALVLIGRGDAASFAIPAAGRAQARAYLDRRVAEYEFGRLLEDLAGQAGRMESVEAAPLDEVEERMAADPNLTPAQRNLMRLRVEDEFKRLQAELAELDEVKAAIEAYGPGFTVAEQQLVAAAVAAVFGDIGALPEAREAYLAALRRLAGTLERIHGVFDDMAALQDLYHLLVDPDAFQRAAQAAQALNDTAALLTADDAHEVVLKDFAVAVSRTLSPDEFFRAYEVDLDQLGFESEQVVRNVRQVMALAGGS